MKAKKYINLIILIQLLILNAYSKDFIDEINNPDRKYGFGHRVIYELNVGSFTKEGTFSAAASKLSDLKSLGIDVVWLMPIYKRDGGLNSPYAASDFKTPNPSYGKVNDL